MKLDTLHLPHIHLHLPGMGLVPAESRQVKPMPMSLRGLVPQPVDKNITVKPSVPDTERDTMPLIIAKAKRTAWQVKRLAEKLKGPTLDDTLRNDSNFILDYIKYKKDHPMHEQIRSPRRLVWEGAGDCDCFATFLAAVLLNQGIPFKFRIAKYQSGDWAHIYVIVPRENGYTTLDPVTNKHNYEVPFEAKKDYDMSGKNLGLGSLQYLDGIGDVGCNCGVPVKQTNTVPPTKKVVVSGKSLEIRDFEPTSNLLDKAGLSYQKKTDVSGNVYYDVTTPSGAVKSVTGFVSMAPADQQKLTNDLLATPAPAMALMDSANNITPLQKKVALSVLLAIGVSTAILSSMRTKPSEGVGALKGKKLAYLKI